MSDVTFKDGTGRIKREEFKLFADVGASSAPEWELQGGRIEDMTVKTSARRRRQSRNRDRRKFCVIDEPRQYENLRLSQE